MLHSIFWFPLSACPEILWRGVKSIGGLFAFALVAIPLMLSLSYASWSGFNTAQTSPNKLSAALKDFMDWFGSAKLFHTAVTVLYICVTITIIFGIGVFEFDAAHRIKEVTSNRVRRSDELVQDIYRVVSGGSASYSSVDSQGTAVHVWKDNNGLAIDYSPPQRDSNGRYRVVVVQKMQKTTSKYLYDSREYFVTTGWTKTGGPVMTPYTPNGYVRTVLKD